MKPVFVSGRTVLGEFAGASVTGRYYDRNEDALGVVAAANVFLVADGCGGAPGRIGSDLAVASFQKFFAKLDGEGARTLPLDPLAAATYRANLDIYENVLANPGGAGYGCTVAALQLGAHWNTVVHAGDCRIYRYQENKLQRLTTDHLAWLERLHQGSPLSEVEDFHKDHANVITRALGLQPDIPLAVQYVSARAADLFLLCSDGLTGCLTDTEISEILARKGASLVERSRWLVEQAERNDCRDNASVLLVQRCL